MKCDNLEANKAVKEFGEIKGTTCDSFCLRWTQHAWEMTRLEKAPQKIPWNRFANNLRTTWELGDLKKAGYLWTPVDFMKFVEFHKRRNE